MRVSNPYSDLRSLLDTTRQLDPEEIAELHLEQGFVDRALSIYEELTAKDPHNVGYQTRRAWLERMLGAQTSVQKKRESASPRAMPSIDATMRGVPAVTREPSEPAASEASRDLARPLRIVRVR